MMQDILIHKFIRSKRRTLSLQITNNAELVVRAPLRLPAEHIEKFIQQKSSWILKKQRQISAYKNAIREKQFVDGEEHSFCGTSYKLRIHDGETITLADYLEFPKALLANPKKHLLTWYKQEAAKKLQERVLLYTNITGLKFATIKLSNAEKRWGSCSSKGNINFNWRLIMTPLEVIDYVVVHELVHLAIKNHSVKFWNKVASILPHYKLAKKYLKEHGRKILLNSKFLYEE